MNKTMHIQDAFARMRQAMAEHGITESEMARKYGIGRKRFCEFKSTPSVSTLYCVAQETGYSVVWMLGLSEEKMRRTRQ